LERDRVYPGLHRIGDSFIVNLDYLAPAQLGSHLELRSRGFSFLEDECSRTNTIRLALDADRLDRHIGRYVVLDRGSALSCRAEDRHMVIADPQTPAWLSDDLSQTLARQLDNFGERLGALPSPKPRLIIGYDPDPKKPSQYRGEAGWRSTIFIRLWGTAWGSPDPMAKSTLANFVSHEAVHLWIGQGAKLAPGDNSALLAEGAAEYLSFLAINENVSPTSASMLREAEGRIAACNRNVGDWALKRGRLAGRAFYDCGFVLQWLVDLEASKQNGKRIWDIWNALLASQLDEISLDSFLERSPVSLAADWLDASTAQDRINAVIESSNGIFHASQSEALPARQITDLVVQHILAEQCPQGPFGFFSEDDQIRLDTGQRCGALSGDPVVKAINGKNVLTDTHALLKNVSAACETGGALRFTDDKERVIASIICRTPLEPPPPPIQIVPIGNQLSTSKH
jgi:hypothetical protein